MTRTHTTLSLLAAAVIIACALLGTAALSGNHSAAGMMPEVVVSAMLPNVAVDTIVVRPAGPGLVAGTMPDRSELN